MKRGAFKPWTNREIERLRTLYPLLRPYQLAEHFANRSYSSVKSMAAHLKLRKVYVSKHTTRRKLIESEHVFKTPYFDTAEFVEAHGRLKAAAQSQ